MFLAGIGIFAALAFVLGLGALALWGLKRFSNLGLSPRSRVPVEVVQRVSLGPKTGLAVVRVGEKVMAVSIGDGGIRPLFELDEADRQRVIASSTVAVPMQSSAEATAAFSKMMPNGLMSMLQRNTHIAAPGAAPVVQTVSATGVPDVNRTTPPTAAPTRAHDDFLSIMRMSLRPTTRLAALLVGVALTSVLPSTLHAQVEPPPPVTTGVQQVSPPATLQSTDSAQQALVQGLQQSAATLPPVQSPPVAPNSRGRGARPATPATPTGNGASLSARNPNGARPMSDMRAPANEGAADQQRASGATTAPVAGGDDALARMVPQMDIQLGNEKEGGLRLNGTVGIVVMMGLLTLLPTLLLMMTGFTRILIVLHFLKQAMGTQGAPPAHLLAALALLLTGFVMAPTFSQMNREAITPWLDGKMTQVEMMKTGVKPMREFMLKQTRPSDLKTFIEMSRMEQPDTPDDVPLHVLMSAFVASELRTAFQIGFAIYLPFIVIDAVVASVLMSMGMFMLPPAMISLPFKLLLFVLVDGWSLTITSLVQSFRQ